MEYPSNSICVHCSGTLETIKYICNEHTQSHAMTKTKFTSFLYLLAKDFTVARNAYTDWRNPGLACTQRGFPDDLRTNLELNDQ